MKLSNSASGLWGIHAILITNNQPQVMPLLLRPLADARNDAARQSLLILRILMVVGILTSAHYYGGGWPDPGDLHIVMVVDSLNPGTCTLLLWWWMA